MILAAYLLLEFETVRLGDDPKADDIRECMDALWLQLTDEERNSLDAR